MTLLHRQPRPRLSLTRGLAALGLLCALSFPAAAEPYKLDPDHTAITWSISHFGFSSPSGKFMNVEGTLDLDEKNPAASKVNVTIPLSGVNTGVPKLDEHLQSKDFFDTATYPNATFVSKSVEMNGKDSALVHGDLTLHGVTRPITLTVRLNKIGPNFFKKQTAGFSAYTSLKRSDFGITNYLPGLGDEVKIAIESEASPVESVTAK